MMIDLNKINKLLQKHNLNNRTDFNLSFIIGKNKFGFGYYDKSFRIIDKIEFDYQLKDADIFYKTISELLANFNKRISQLNKEAIV